MESKSPHVTIMYVLLAILAAWLFYSQLVGNSVSNAGTWQCSNAVCSRDSSPEQWAQQNCFETQVADGSTQVVCRVLVDGANQLIPLSSLNLSALRVCLEYTCVQEVNVRQANYTIDASRVTQR